MNLAVRIHRRQLDQALAEGADPGSDPLLSSRAAQLCEPAAREALARQLRDVIESADEPPRISSVAPIARAAIEQNSGRLRLLAARLETPGRLGVQGIAATRLMLTDGGSPLWGNSDPHALEDWIKNALIGCGVS